MGHRCILDLAVTACVLAAGPSCGSESPPAGDDVAEASAAAGSAADDNGNDDGNDDGVTEAGGSEMPDDGNAESGAASPCEGLIAEGNAEGDIAENWTLNDRDGNPVHLWDYCGKVIFVEDGAEW